MAELSLQGIKELAGNAGSTRGRKCVSSHLGRMGGTKLPWSTSCIWIRSKLFAHLAPATFDINHAFFFALAAASGPWTPSNTKARNGSAALAPWTHNICHAISFALVATSGSLITWHPKGWLGSATSALGTTKLDHVLSFAFASASDPPLRIMQACVFQPTAAHLRFTYPLAIGDSRPTR